MQNAISMYSMWRCTPVYNLTHLAPQDNFSLMPNCSLGPSEYEIKIFSKINSFAILRDLGGGGGTYKFNHILAHT